MKPNAIEYPCKCGHWKVDHMIDQEGQVLNYDGSARCIWSQFCRCDTFQADNLMYLESFIEEDDSDNKNL